MPIEIYHVDAFANEPFRGNPAAVFLLDRTMPDGWMQAMAAEMNLSETAFVRPREEGFHLRWFTPRAEVGLCGHATLASAHVLWEAGAVPSHESIGFHTRSGLLTTRLLPARIEMDLPVMPAEEAPLPEVARRALGVETRFTGRAPDRGGHDMDYLVELESEEAVRALRPDLELLRESFPPGIIVTAPAESGRADFVSRFFAPWIGIDEDPVTGAAHCTLVPFWAPRLGKREMVGFQASPRGGFVYARLGEGRVYLSGETVTVLRGTWIDHAH